MRSSNTAIKTFVLSFSPSSCYLKKQRAYCKKQDRALKQCTGYWSLLFPEVLSESIYTPAVSNLQFMLLTFACKLAFRNAQCNFPGKQSYKSSLGSPVSL